MSSLKSLRDSNRTRSLGLAQRTRLLHLCRPTPLSSPPLLGCGAPFSRKKPTVIKVGRVERDELSVGRGESEDVDEGDETGEADHVDFRAQVGRTIEVPLTELICAKKSRRGCQPFEMLDKLKLVIALGDDEFEPVERVEEDDEWEIILEGGKDADELGGGQTGPTWAAVVARS